MGLGRLAAAVALLLALGGIGAAAYVATREPPGVAGEHRVLVQGPTGALFDGVVSAERGTALDALLATGLDVDVVEYPNGLYVAAIQGVQASGPAGWVYEVERDGRWVSGDRSAAEFALREGEAVRWSWTGG